MAHNGGRLQANFKSGFAESSPFLNKLKSSNSGLGAVNSTDNGWGALINSNHYPSSMPVGAGAYWTWGQVRIYGDLNDEYDLYFPSQHTVVLADNEINTTGTEIAPGHWRYTIDETPPFVTTGGRSVDDALTSVRITAMSGSDWTGGIILCAYKLRGVVVDHKARIDAGEIFDPVFLDYLNYEDGSGRVPLGMLRFMDVLGPTYKNYTRKFSHQHAVADSAYESPIFDERYHAGIATKTLNHYTVTDFPGSPSSWEDGQVVQFWMPTRPTTMTVTAATVGSPTQFTVVGHGLTTGEKVGLNSDSGVASQWRTPLTTVDAVTGIPPDFEVTVIDPDTFTIPLDSTGFSAPSDLRLMPIITIAGGSLGEKRIWRQHINHHFSSEFSTYASGGNITGVYYAEFDAVMMGGDNDKNTLRPGWPVEIIGALCKKIGAHCWVALPPYLEGAEQRSYLTALKTEFVGTGLWPVTERGNEEWNSSTAYVHQQGYYRTKGRLGSYGLPTGASSAVSSITYGAAVADMCDNAATVFGSDLEYKTVLTMQAVSSPGAETNRLQCPALSSGNTALYPGNRVDWIAIAPYIEPNVRTTGASYAGFIDDCLTPFDAGDTNTAYDWYLAELINSSSGTDRQPLDVQLTFGAAWISGLASYTGRSGNGVELVHYEWAAYNSADSLDTGFPSGAISVADVQAFEYGFWQSEQNGTFHTTALEAFDAQGVAWCSIYTIAGVHTTGQGWGLRSTEVQGSAANPAWVAVMAFNGTDLPDPDPVVEDNSGHDGKRKKRKPEPRQEYPDDDRPSKKPPHEVNREKYVKDRNSLLSLLKRLFGLADDEPKIAQMQFLAEAPAAKTVSPALMKFLKTGKLPIAEMKAKVPEAVDTKAFDDVVAEYDRLREQMLKDDEEIAFVVAMMH